MENTESLILLFTALAAKQLRAESPQEVERLERELEELKSVLGMATEEIILEAVRMTVR